MRPEGGEDMSCGFLGQEPSWRKRVSEEAPSRNVSEGLGKSKKTSVAWAGVTGAALCPAAGGMSCNASLMPSFPSWNPLMIYPFTWNAGQTPTWPGLLGKAQSILPNSLRLTFLCGSPPDCPTATLAFACQAFALAIPPAWNICPGSSAATPENGVF